VTVPDGAVHDSDTELAVVLVTVRLVGAPGTLDDDVFAVTVDEKAPVPPAFHAATSKM
jgi:hypothetical protein